MGVLRGPACDRRRQPPRIIDILRLAILVFGAFLAAALVQRVILGEYGGWKLGPAQLDPIKKVSATVEDEIAKLRKETQGSILAATAEAKAGQLDLLRKIAELNGRLDSMKSRSGESDE